MIGPLLRLVSLLVPHALRPRWREEWTAELNHSRAQGLRLRARVRMAAGSVADAIATRRINKGARGPRPGIFHAVDPA